MVMQLTAGSESTMPSAAPACGNNGQSDRLGMANPAATYCRELGYDYRVGRSSKGEEGICVFPDGKECEEWKFLSGKCGRERSYCARQGLDVVTKNNGADSLSPEYAECVSGGREVGSVSELMGLSQKATKGSIPLTGSEPPQGEEPPITGAPPSFDWRNEGGVDWMTSVKDQGGCGSCWAFSMVGVIEGAYNVQRGDPNLDLDLAEEYLVSDCYTMGFYGNCCGGSYEDAFEFVRDSGIPDEACMAYVDGTSCSCASSCDVNCTYRSTGSCSDATCSDRCSDWQSRLVSIDASAPVPSGQMKEYLVSEGPLSVAMGVGSGYGGAFDAQGVYRCSNDDGANHAVVVVGYSDAAGYWIVKNSWGAGWNGDGYFKVGYGECAIETWPYYVDAPVTPAATPTPTACPSDDDCDGILDTADNCPSDYNPDQTNTDSRTIDNGPVVTGDDVTVPNGDTLGDACDPDGDNDWLSDTEEAAHGTGPLVVDSDGDRVVDGAEVVLGSDPLDPGSKPPCVRATDMDRDCLPDDLEAIFGADPTKKDTDGDGISDGAEVRGWGTSPAMKDTGGDGCDDDKEIVEINGDAVVNTLDEARVAQRVFNVQDDDPNDGNPVPDWDMQVTPAFDVNKDGVMNPLDEALVVLNSNLVEAAEECDCR
jgi:putative hemolysin/C1A family cysteine protease